MHTISSDQLVLKESCAYQNVAHNVPFILNSMHNDLIANQCLEFNSITHAMHHMQCRRSLGIVSLFIILELV